jgi:hypothetical protein
MSRVIWAAGGLVLAAVSVVAVIALGVLPDSESDASRSGLVAKRLRATLERPGADQIAPDGQGPSRVSCRDTAKSRWSCRVGYASGLELECVVASVRADSPICADYQPSGRG